MNNMIKGRIIEYLDDNIDQKIDRNELQVLVEKAILKTLLQIRLQRVFEKANKK